MSAASAAVLTADAAKGDARRIGVLFMAGSACFALASLPGASSVSERVVAVTYFVGSIFFTTAAFEQLRTARGQGNEVAAALVQFAGTLFFNVTTFAGMIERLDAHQADLLVWSPDALGSVCFLVSSADPVARDLDDAGRGALLLLGGARAGQAASVVAPEARGGAGVSRVSRS